MAPRTGGTCRRAQSAQIAGQSRRRDRDRIGRRHLRAQALSAARVKAGGAGHGEACDAHVNAQAARFAFADAAPFAGFAEALFFAAVFFAAAVARAEASAPDLRVARLFLSSSLRSTTLLPVDTAPASSSGVTFSVL